MSARRYAREKEDRRQSARRGALGEGPDGSRCTGHCCPAFTIPLSPDELSEAYRAWREQDYAESGLDRNGRKKIEDIFLIAPMVEHLGLFQAGDAPPGCEDVGKALDKDCHYYRCKHLGEAGDCTIYDIRPAMCRRYPGGRACRYAGCTWTAAREGRIGEGGEPGWSARLS